MESVGQYVSRLEYEVLVDKHQELRKRHEKLLADHAKTVAHDKAITDKYQEAKVTFTKWSTWIEKHHDVIQEVSRVLSEKTAKAKVPARVTSSQTTEGELDDTIAADPEPDSGEEPEVISTRCLKRKRGPSEVRIKTEPETQRGSADACVEISSSPASRSAGVVRKEASDLDVQTEHIETPRKCRRGRAKSEEAVKPSALLAAISSLSDRAVPAEIESNVYIKMEPRSNSYHDSQMDAEIDVSTATPANNILQQRSVNIPSCTTPSSVRAATDRKRRLRLAELSEDGEDRSSQERTKLEQTTPRPGAHSRLDLLLDNHSSGAKLLPKRHTLEVKQARTSIKPEQPSAQARAPEAPRSSKRTACVRPRGMERSPSPPDPEDEPLRSRPLNRLNIDDFKINRHYLGSDFAFADTLRGRDQRRCLPGCTDPECCGNAFQKAVAMGLIQITKPDSQVLEQYLGPEYATLMEGYSRDTTNEVLIKAHAFAFANEHGKHRQAFEKRSEPPGFWRVDMPSTQEEAEDRLRAVVQEREKVEQRWREAMRGGGRWSFRDE